MDKPARLILDKILTVAVMVSAIYTRFINALFVDISGSAVVAGDYILHSFNPHISHPEEYPRGFFGHVD